jgi:hypothetical protein
MPDRLSDAYAMLSYMSKIILAISGLLLLSIVMIAAWKSHLNASIQTRPELPQSAPHTSSQTDQTAIHQATKQLATNIRSGSRFQEPTTLSQSTTTLNIPDEISASPPSAIGTIACSQLRATIDERSLTSTSTNPTITGTASNVTNSGTTIHIVLYSENRQIFTSGYFAIVGNRWSIPVYQGILSPGIYTVFVYDHLYENCSDTLRATGTLTIKAVH